MYSQTTSMVLEKDCMSAETLSVLRDKFSPFFGADNESVRPIVTIFNKLKNNLPEETYLQVLGLLLQYDTSQTAEKPYHHILVENRILHILREYEGLRFELLDVLHNTASHDDHILSAVQNNRDSKESMNDEGVKGGIIQADNINQMACSSSDVDDKTMQLSDDTEKHPSREFSLSRQLYQKIPTSLHDSNVEDSSASDEEMQDMTPSTELKNEVLDHQHPEAPTETLGANDESESGTSTTKMGFSKNGSCKRKVQSSDMSVDEGGGEIGKGEDSSEGRVVGESSSKGGCVSQGHKSEMGGRSRKRTRRLGAREDDMMLKKVGSHCIVIGVKEHAMTTDSSDYNTQSETDTMGSEPVTSQDDDEEGVLVIAEEKQPSSKPKKQKRNRSRKSSANLVKVSALCRGATILEKCETRNKKGKKLKEDAQQVVSKSEFRLPRSQNNINNNSCSASEISDEEVSNTYLEVTSGSEGLSFCTTAPHASDDERTVLDILNSENSEDYRSGKQTCRVSMPQDYQFLKCHRKRTYPDSSISITPFTSYLGLQPSGSDGNLSNSTQDDTNCLPKSDKTTPGSYYNAAKSRPASLVGSRSYSKSTRPKYNPNFPFSTSAFSAMSSIAEATSFEGSDYLLNEESSQDDIPEYSEYDDTASSQDGYLERERVYGLGTFAQDDADDISFLNRLLRSPSPPNCTGNDGIWVRKRRRRHKPKKDRKPRKPRRSRRLRGKRSRDSDGDGDTKDNIPNNASKPATGRACTCCS